MIWLLISNWIKNSISDRNFCWKSINCIRSWLSGTSTTVADKIAIDLQAQSYTVTFAGIKSSAAAHTSGYSIIVVGGPVYAGSPSASVKDDLKSLKPDSGTEVGVFGSGSGATSQSDIDMIKSAVPALSSSGSLSNAIVVKNWAKRGPKRTCV